MKKFISVILSAVMLLSFCSFGFAADDAAALRFDDDGNFRILQIADIQDGPFLLNPTKNFIADVLEETDPDLVILTGDNISGGGCFTDALARHGIYCFMSIFEEYGVPVAAVFGNHDSEGAATKEEMMEMYEAYDCFVGCAGEDLTGCGNYNLPIMSSDGKKVAYNIWCIDSLTYNEKNPGKNDPGYYENDLEGYGCVHKDQIDWYVKTSNELKAANGGAVVPSMMFQHIVVPEIYDVLVKTQNGYELPEGTKGELLENPCPPEYTNGQFDAVVNQGDVVAMFFGHDHKNSFELTYKGVDLVNTPGVGFSSYGDYNRGARVIDIKESDTSTYTTEVITWLEFYDAENNAAAKNEFIVNGNEFSTAEKIEAFFGYIFAKIAGIFTF